MNDTIYQAAALIIPLVIAIVFHEVHTVLSPNCWGIRPRIR